ncbi:uncharacterized protein MELLADRAFT_116821 [Melampsora larici-populina 98AG31]|uniref:Uncharacterized protein n=1 Tax=Melampsora larici-populina (strain 98AG31 / pathotype 3-4-7) TaxID=747676 RepID=F4RQ61_MELLP|nr:uncharacterized protein MELLADRAFT_116821 [Melampsora larici-populina 98AG31]EGG05464.1 hypothetical protein MELLADRAFT_116821 [Melampsora larici-populina 98AG31]
MMPQYHFGKNPSGSEENRKPYLTKLFSCHSSRVFDDPHAPAFVRRQTIDLQRSLCSEPSTLNITNSTDQSRGLRPKLLRTLRSYSSLKPSIVHSQSAPFFSKPPTPDISRPCSISPVSFNPPSESSQPSRRRSRLQRDPQRHTRSHSNGSVFTIAQTPCPQEPILVAPPCDRWPAQERDHEKLHELTDEMGAWLSSLAESSSRARARHLAGLSRLPTSTKEQEHRRHRVEWDLQAPPSSPSFTVNSGA